MRAGYIFGSLPNVVRLPDPQFQILRPVIMFDPIFVMYGLPCPKRPAKHLGHYLAVFLYICAVVPHTNITLAVNISLPFVATRSLNLHLQETRTAKPAHM